MRRGTDYLLRLRPWSLSAYAADYDRFAVLLPVSALTICFSHLYREALALIRK